MKKKYIWLIEIVIWLLILSLCLFFFVYKTTIKENVQNTYYIFFDDADGLVKGSAVRLMGINIGYVRDVKIFDNKVFVSFLVTKEDVKIPKYATAAIEFYGLGGSTSLELIPSYYEGIENKENIIPVQSYRVQDFWEGQKLVANVMIDIYGGIGRTIQLSGILNNKEYLKQSSLIKNYAMQTGAINTAQSVLIYKLSEKNQIKEENNISENSSEVEKDE
ncbi:MAG: MlaD family protein [Candidatus Gastranaerophilales bacterium]|nr:MlaD family protein [Candidatus Gastranaerophilales bacterium]